MRRLLSSLAITSCLLTSFTLPNTALANGLTLFSGVKSGYQLPFHLDFSGRRGAWDRYRLRIPTKKMKFAVARLIIAYPKSYKGTFDPKKIAVKVRGKKIKLSETNWDKENRVIEIYPEEPIPAGFKTEVVLSNVLNPSSGGMFYFQCLMRSPGDVPLSRYIGTWIIDIS
ncbi:MAG: DUF2808 domain-containing protein [Calothrix sp. MO_167.B42]|nr:DUF2808 domain-containing protein [Calothrix sp. MO_167.B42]